MKYINPAPFEESKPIAKLLIFLGITGISFFILGILSLVMEQSGIVDLTRIADAANYTDSNVVREFRVFQLISDVFIFILPVAVLVFLVSRHRFQYLQMNKTGGLLVLLLGMITILVSTPFISYINELNQQIPLPDKLKGWEDTGDALENALMAHHTIKDLLLNLLVMALAAAISEELFFRAGLQKLLVSMTKNIHAGIWLAAIIFSAVHMQFSGFFPRMLLGVFLGYLFVWSGSIWVNIAAHFIFNASQIIVLYLQATQSNPAMVSNTFSETPGYGYIAVSAVLVILLIMLIYRFSRGKGSEVSITSE